MKARLVKEAMDFTREGDPMDKLQLGDPDIRKINLYLSELGDFVKRGYSEEELNFNKTINMVDHLRLINDYILINHVQKKFGWKIQRISDDDRRVGKVTFPAGDTITFCKSSSSRTFFMQYSGTERETTKAAMNLKTLDKKIQDLIKKYQIQS